MRRAIALLMLVPLMSACFGVGAQESVLVKTVSSDMAFGANPSSNAQATQPLPQVIPSLGLDNGFPPPFNVGVVSSGGLCPTPGPDVFPLDPALPDIQGKPAAGTYEYRESGTEALAIANVINVKFALNVPVITRTVKDVTANTNPALAALNSGAFSFLDDGGFGFQFMDPKLTAGYESLPNSTDANTQSVPPYPQAEYPTPVPSSAPSPVQSPPNDQVGASSDGVYLTSLHFTTPPIPSPQNGVPPVPVTFDFSVVPGAAGSSPVGVQLMQVPAVNREQWSSSASDAADGTSIAFAGGINPDGTHGSGKEFIDGCNEVFDTWRVDGTLTLTGKSIAITDQVTFWFAPQYGGLLLQEDHTLTHAVLGAYDFSNTTFRISLNHLKPVS